MSDLIPEPMDREQLAAVLEDMAARVRVGDSFEGNLQYAMPIVDDVESPPGWGSWPNESADFWVTAVYRVGNTQGQGGMRVIGRPPGRTSE